MVLKNEKEIAGLKKANTTSTLPFSLYRKYRPQTFGEMRGQEEVVRALTGALSQKSVAHAYLFAGGRGTGKTSVARIFARELGISSDDLYEIDAASNRGIDDVREIRDGVAVLPFKSPYKMYLIDEAHMLTKEAFNALLKTLEEPPAHVIFVLATTELRKFPETIISRCQVLHFQKPSLKILSEMVEEVAKKEGYKIGADVANIIAKHGDGSFRDTYGVLQRVISSTDSKVITADFINKVIGIPQFSFVLDYVQALCLPKDPVIMSKAFDALSSASNSSSGSVHAQHFYNSVVQMVRQVLMNRLRGGNGENGAKDAKDANGAKGPALMSDFPSIKDSVNINSKTLYGLLSLESKIRTASNPYFPLEAFLYSLGEN